MACPRLGDLGGGASQQHLQVFRHRIDKPLGRLRIRQGNLPPIVVPFPMRALEPWTTGKAERSPEAMVLLYRVQEAGSPMNCAA